MLKIKDGRLYGTNYSFALPEGFNLLVGTDFIGGDKLVFASDNEHLRIAVYFEKQHCSADNGYFVKKGDCLSVRRGKGAGIGMYYDNAFGANQHYEERYDFEKNEYGETRITIDISLSADRNKQGQTVREALKQPAVKAFLESVEYF